MKYTSFSSTIIPSDRRFTTKRVCFLLHFYSFILVTLLLYYISQRSLPAPTGATPTRSSHYFYQLMTPQPAAVTTTTSRCHPNQQQSLLLPADATPTGSSHHHHQLMPPQPEQSLPPPADATPTSSSYYLHQLVPPQPAGVTTSTSWRHSSQLAPCTEVRPAEDNEATA